MSCLLEPIVRPLDGFVFDLDGTVYLGEEALPGAVTAVAELRRRGKRLVFVSNKPLQPREAYAQKLTRLGIPTAPEQILTSTLVLGSHLAASHPGLRYYVVGEPRLKQELAGYGLTILEELEDQDPRAVIDPAGIDAVIVSFDRSLAISWKFDPLGAISARIFSASAMSRGILSR